MSNIERDYIVKLDIKTGYITSPEEIYFYNTDKNTNNIYVKLIANDTLNATDLSVEMNVIKPKNIIKQMNGVLVNQEQALFKFELPEDFTNLCGWYKFEFMVSRLVTGIEEKITSSPMHYIIKKSILTNTNDSIEDNEDYPILLKLIEEVKELKEELILGNYALISDIPTKLSQLENDSAFMTSIPEEYITEAELNEKGYLTEHQSLEDYALISSLHNHDNKELLDSINTDKIADWDKSIIFENTYITDCDEWLTNGYIKTSDTTINHPSVCTDSSKWGLLFYLSENAAHKTGTQLYFPIDGNYKGRVFSRSICKNVPTTWQLLSIDSNS